MYLHLLSPEPRFAYAGSLHDWKYKKECWHLEDYYNADRCCDRCRAHKKDPALLYTDANADAGWLNTIYSNEQFMATHVHTPTALMRRPGAHVQLLREDVQHTCHLGTAKILNAQCIVELCHEGFFGPTALPMHSRLRSAHVAFKAWCKASAITCSQPCFTPRRLNLGKLSNYPEFVCLCKSWNMRVVAAWVASVCAAANDHTEPKRLRALCAYGQAEFYLALEQSPRYLSVGQAERIYKAGVVCLKAYSALRGIAQAAKRRAWVIRPKFHRMHHLCLDLRRELYNPRFYHCYADEDFVGRIVRISRRCHKRCVSRRALQMWQLRLRTVIKMKLKSSAQHVA